MSVRSLLTDYRPPGGRTAPPEVTRQLREIDERAELIYVGQGRWLLGTVKHDRELQLRARRVMSAFGVARSHAEWWDMPKELRRQVHYRAWKATLRIQGFRDVAVYHQHMPDSGIAEDFRVADWIWRHERAFRAAQRAAERADDGTAELEERTARVLECLELEHKNIHRHAFRHPRSRDVIVDFEDGRIVQDSPAGPERGPDIDRRSAVA